MIHKSHFKHYNQLLLAQDIPNVFFFFLNNNNLTVTKMGKRGFESWMFILKTLESVN